MDSFTKEQDEMPVDRIEEVEQEAQEIEIQKPLDEEAKKELEELKVKLAEAINELKQTLAEEEALKKEMKEPISEEMLQTRSKESRKVDEEILRAKPKGAEKITHAYDEELRRMVAQQRAKIKIIGCGGAGNNTITRMFSVKIAGTHTIAVNTDAQDLLYTNADEKILLGKELTKGLGAGSIPKIGEEAARENEKEIRQSLQGADMVFVTCGLGGGTGTGSAPIIAEAAKKLGCLTIGIVTLPFTMEGKRRSENALNGLEKLQSNVDTLIVISNDKLLDLAPELPLHTAFKVADEILTNAVKGIAELITKPGLVNLDFADVRAVMDKGGLALIGLGESDSDNRAVEAIEKSLSNPLLDVDVSGAKGALINIIGGADFTLEEARKIVEKVSTQVDEHARVIWGAQIDEILGKTIKTLLIITGVKSSDFWANTKKASEKRKKEIENELGIRFVD